jgi:hypothetical protein
MVPNQSLLSEISIPGTKSGEVVMHSGTEWYVKAVKNNDRKSKKKRNNYVIVQLEIYARDD